MGPYYFPVCNGYDLWCDYQYSLLNNSVGELVRALLSFKRPTGSHRTETEAIIRKFHLGVRLNQIKSNHKNFYSAPYNNGRERLTKYIGLIIKYKVKYI